MAFLSTSIAQTKFHNDEIPRGKMKGPLTIWITLVTLLCTLAIPVLHTALAKPAPAEHPEYRDAINDLRNARKHLKRPSMTDTVIAIGRCARSTMLSESANRLSKSCIRTGPALLPARGPFTSRVTHSRCARATHQILMPCRPEVHKIALGETHE